MSCIAANTATKYGTNNPLVIKRWRFWLPCRAYLYTSYAVGSAGFVYALVKGALFEYDGAWLPPAAVIVTFATFSWAHILAARWGSSSVAMLSLEGVLPVVALACTKHCGTCSQTRPPGLTLRAACLAPAGGRSTGRGGGPAWASWA